MGLLKFTKSYSAGDDGTTVTGNNIGTIQADIAAILNGGISNVNVASDAAIVETKISFNAASGHTHNGTDSTLVAATNTHYRKGFLLSGDDDDNIVVQPGVIELNGAVYTATATSGDLAIATDANWISGVSGKSASAWVYVYVYNDSGSIGYKLHSAAPDLSDCDDNTTFYPWRYLLDSDVYYRCIGCVFMDADEDLCWGHASSEGLYVSQFDASNTCIIGGLGTGADQTVNTLWTPKFVKVIYGKTDATPATTEDLAEFSTTKQMLTAAWYGTALNVTHSGATHDWIAITTAGSVNAITAQAAGTAGSFTIDAMTDGYYWYAIASTDVI